MNLYELTQIRDFDTTKKIKIVRHQDSNYDVEEMRSRGFLEFYQAVQSKPIFDECDYIFSFIGTERSTAVFTGLFKVNGRINYEPSFMPENFIYPDMCESAQYFYILEKDNLFDDLIDRLVIDWGKSTRTWVQWFRADKAKEVIEILPKGYVKDFPGFDDVLLTFDELETIVRNPDANRIWHTMLSSVAGVYLIIDLTTGDQYVGSAYGEAGILGRWKCYVNTFHGSNKCMMDLLTRQPGHHRNFQYSILQTLPRSMNKDLVIGKEQLFKRKLGSKAFGLNAN